MNTAQIIVLAGFVLLNAGIHIEKFPNIGLGSTLSMLGLSIIVGAFCIKMLEDWD